jgi:hypothetical protein
LNNTGILATLATDMDMKTLMDMWKQFGKLSTKYCSELKIISSDNIIHHIKALTKSIGSVLLNINEVCFSNTYNLISSNLFIPTEL